LKKGDSIYFDSNMGHAYIAVGDAPCRILSICIAPESELIKFMEGKTKPAGKHDFPTSAKKPTISGQR
jgi:oxalate decarboxylase/phosphoglucose isomerase-like protein (cupin superfamily)